MTMQTSFILAALLVNCAAGQKWYFRGTPNNWGSNEMRKRVDSSQPGVDLGFCHTEQFAGNGDGFKISSSDKDWTEAYPSSNWEIYQGAGVYDICFNTESKWITVKKLDNFEGPYLVITHKGNRVSLPMTRIHSQFARVTVFTYMRIEYIQAGTEFEVHAPGYPPQNAVITVEGRYAFFIKKTSGGDFGKITLERVF